MALGHQDIEQLLWAKATIQIRKTDLKRSVRVIRHLVKGVSGKQMMNSDLDMSEYQVDRMS